MIVDSHSHLFLEEFSEDLPQVIERARAAGVSHIFMPNIDSSTIEPMLTVCRNYEGYCFPMIGLHPTSVDRNYEKQLAVVAEYLERTSEFVAVGEIGLDLYWDKTYLEEQLQAFDRQIRWALEYQLPVVIHCRDAFEYIYKVLAPYKNTSLTGVFHSFTGTSDEAKKMREFPGFKIGINGVVTFKKSSLPEVLKHIPLECIVLETDSPYLTPAPHRGKRNESAYLENTLMKVAEIYGECADIVSEKTSENALKLFGVVK